MQQILVTYRIDFYGKICYNEAKTYERMFIMGSNLRSIISEIITKYDAGSYDVGISRSGLKKAIVDTSFLVAAVFAFIVGRGMLVMLSAIPMIYVIGRKGKTLFTKILYGFGGALAGIFYGGFFAVSREYKDEVPLILGMILIVVYFFRMRRYTRVNSIIDIASKDPNRPLDEIIKEDSIMISEETKKKIITGYVGAVALIVIIPIILLFTEKTEIKYQLNDDGTGYIVERYKENFLDKEVKVNVPSEYNGLPVVEVDGGAFSRRDGLVEVVIPESVTYIGGEAFRNCKNLRKVVLPDNLEHIKGDTFSGCVKLVDINLPKSLKEIHGNAFYRCISLRDVEFPKGLKRIGGHAFHDCDSLTKVTFPDSLREIGSSAFRNCDNLREANLSNRTKYNNRAFKESPTEIHGGIIFYSDDDTSNKSYNSSAALTNKGTDAGHSPVIPMSDELQKLNEDLSKKAEQSLAEAGIIARDTVADDAWAGRIRARESSVVSEAE